MSADFDLLKFIDVLRTVKDDSNCYRNVENLLIESVTQGTFEKVIQIGFKRLKSYFKATNVVPTKRLILSIGIATYYKQCKSANFKDIETIHKALTNPKSNSNSSVKLTHIPNVSTSISKSTKYTYTSIVLSIPQTNCLIFQYLDLQSLFKCRRVNQRWLYDAYNPLSIYHIDLSQVMQYCEYNCKQLQDGAEETLDNTNANYNDIDKAIPITWCQSIKMTTKDTLYYARKWPWAVVNTGNDNNININVDHVSCSYNDNQTHEYEPMCCQILIPRLKYLKIDMELQQRVTCLSDKHLRINWNNLRGDCVNSKYVTDWTEDNNICQKITRGKEWLSRWIQNHGDRLKSVTILLQNNVYRYYFTDQPEYKCCKMKYLCNNVHSYANFINIMNQQLWGKENNFIKFKVTKPLSIDIQGEAAIKWRHASLDLSKSKKLVSIVRVLRKWYENGNIDIRLNFKVTYVVLTVLLDIV